MELCKLLTISNLQSYFLRHIFIFLSPYFINIGESLKFGASFLYYWTYRSFPWTAFLKMLFNTLMNILKDQTLALTIESPCLKYEIANLGCIKKCGATDIFANLKS